MTMSERSRSEIYRALRTMVSQKAVNEMLSYFPASDVDEPVTKEFLRAEMATQLSEIRSDIRELRVMARLNIVVFVAFTSLIVAMIKL